MFCRRFLEAAMGLAIICATTALSLTFYDYWQYRFPQHPPIHQAAPQEIARIDEVLNILPPAFSREIGAIIVVDSILPQIGGCCLPDNRINSIVIFTRGFMPKTILFHEFTHAHCRTLALPAWEEWRLIKRGVYLKDDWQKDSAGFYPREGFARHYGRKNEDEDIGTWGEEIFDYLHGEPNTLTNKFNKTDPAYRQIFDWFLRWGFISGKQHAKLVKEIL